MNMSNNDNDYILAVVKWLIGGMVALGGIAIAAIKKEKIVPLLKTIFGIELSDDIAEDIINEAKEQLGDIDDPTE